MRILKKLKRLIILSCALCCVIFVPGCKKQKKEVSIEAIKKDGEFIVLTNATFPPYEFYEGGQIVGIDIDITKLIAEKLEIKLKITDTSFDGLLAALESNKGHMIAAGMSLTPENENAFPHSIPYASSNQRILAAKKRDDITCLADLVNKKIGVSVATTSFTFMNNQLEKEPFKNTNTTLVTYPSITESVQALENGYIDAVVSDDLPAEFAAEKNSKLKLLPQLLAKENFVFLFAKETSPDLKNLVDNMITEMKENGTLDEITKKYAEAVIK